ncbi:MAG: hypothetical protein JW888_02895 [Pirellulales bacterium]|nr:hypothetical protein [Pirellulales bacterium]
MNYFAHALPFLDRPYLAVATGVPDMLMVVDRRIRVRSKHVIAFVNDPDPVQSAVARGMLQHFCDDRRFHDTPSFAELNLNFSVTIRDALGGESSMRPRFLAHLLVELLLDAALAAEWPDRLKAYYRALGAIDPDRLQTAFNRMAPRPTLRLAGMVRAVGRERFLSDYRQDDTLMVRLNQVLRRVGLETLPSDFVRLLAPMRRQTASRKDELLDGIPTPLAATKAAPSKNQASDVA